MSDMKQLKKYAAVGGAIALVLCWPLAVGQIGQNVIEDGVAQMNSDAVTAEIVQYDRGYLSSTVQTRYTITDPVLAAQLEADAIPAEIIVNSTLSHGLLSISADSQMVNWPDLPLTLHTVTQLNGNSDFEFKLDNWHQVSEGEEGAMLSVTPSTLKGHVTVLGEVSYQLDVPSIEVDFNSGEKLLVSGITGNGEGKQVNSFWIGDQQIALVDMAVLDSAQTPLFALKKAQYVYSSFMDEPSKRVTTKHNISVGDVLMDQEEVSNFEVDFALGELDAVAFEQLVLAYQNAPMMSTEDMQKMIPHIDSLFSNGFYLSMDKLAMTVGQGEFTSEWKLTVPQGTNDVSRNPMSIMPALQGHIDTFVSNGLVAQYPALQQGVDEGMIMEFVQQTDEGYRVKAELKEGSFVFENGQKVPLMSLLLPLMM
ncbi:hypothetical protein VII00023_21237 [Vibrio ichthyoenteri ATCC 700023]|uniref:DUF945 domain-containing protein n=1 Tax=Vibrio ichthyoenteri ATCC 700023 TaxID=870968 RepID=F9S3H9_9VIBR|nr:DUF945 family protein [Vibrio ichthyoenteri]EGU38074.1 hypothetical protein VII00023_21237 [Vibrio ichthyoenteri ATCC 700023]